MIPSARPTYAYPHARGNLLLKQEEIRFDATERRVESIECLNGGNDTLRVGIDTQILPPCIRAEFTPAELLPGAIGELTVRFDPAAGKAPPAGFRSSSADWDSHPGRAPSRSASHHKNNDSKIANN